MVDEMVLNDIKMLCDSLFFHCYSLLFVAFVFFSPLIFTVLPLLSKLASGGSTYCTGSPFFVVIIQTHNYYICILGI
jgi:hypothetical protein